MRLQSLKSKLLIAVSALVIGSGLLISLLVTQRYSSSLFETMAAQAENLAHGVALQAADEILINDLVALQKMLDHQMHSNPSVSYLFIVKDNQVLAHTFTTGFPAELTNVNLVNPGEQSHLQEIASASGEHYLDIAWPIFGGKGGVLRLGFSKKPYRLQMTKLWLQMTGLTLAILLLGLSGTILFVRRVTRPLASLALATQKVHKGEPNVSVQVQGHDEVATLAHSFNHMVARMEEYTHQLEEQTMELERAHHQTRTFCGIVQEVGALRSLEDIGSYLINKLEGILKCGHILLLFFNSNRDILFALSPRCLKSFEEPEVLQTTKATLEGLTGVTFMKKMVFSYPIVPKHFHEANRQAIVPLSHENLLFGAVVIGCPGECNCNLEEVNTVGLMLTNAAGVIKRAISQEEEIKNLQSRIETSAEFNGIVGRDPKMQLIYKLIEDIAPTDATVLIQGESGTGKELVARAIHQLSPRKDKPFVVINCSAYPATLLESELFGHEKGAFTGAIRQKSGRFEQADGGTVFLDEIGEISPSAQIKLLRVLQTQKFERLGGEQTLTVDVRILAATNKDLIQEVKNGHFREDLYYRLNVIPVHLPPLRDRHNDIPLLARHFLRRFAAEQGKDIEDFSPEAMRSLLDCSWPGNVRELENSIEHATVLAKGGRIEAPDLPAVLHSAAALAGAATAPSLVDHEKILLEEALEECGWNKKQAAKRNIRSLDRRRTRYW
jgi:two-component system response regulator HydG